MSNATERLIDALPGVAFTAGADGAVDYVSQGWCRYTGRQAQTALGDGWLVVVHPDDRDGLLAQWRALISDGVACDLRARLRGHDGEYRTFLLRTSRQVDGWCGLFIDIESMLTPPTPLGTQDLYTLIDSIPALVSLMTPEGELERLNCHNLAYMGSTFEELRRWAVTDTIHPEDLPSVTEAWYHSVRTGEPYRKEHRIRRADGRYHWFVADGLPMRDAQGRITRWLLINVDIDQQKRDKALIAQALAQVSASEDRLRTIIDTVPGFVWSAAPDGSVGFVNQRWCDYTGVTQAQARGAGWTASVHPQDVDQVTHFWHALLHSREAGECEARLRRHDGVHRWFLIRAVPQRDQAGEVLCWYGENTDIEDRKRAEAALGKVRAELAHLARVASLGVVTASIAHEVNQPLAGIITNASTCLRMLGADPPNVAGALETARRTIRDGNRASDVINRLRALYSKKDFSIEDVDLNEAAREVIALLLGELQRNGVMLHPAFADNLPTVRGDRVQLQQVILNLILNATEAMTTVAEHARRLVVSTGLGDPGTVFLQVTDNGVGFEAQEAERLFNAFYTTKRSGMGIGLSISRSIIERHDGQLRALLNDGPGATVRFSLPLAATGDNAKASESARERRP